MHVLIKFIHMNYLSPIFGGVKFEQHCQLTGRSTPGTQTQTQHVFASNGSTHMDPSIQLSRSIFSQS